MSTVRPIAAIQIGKRHRKYMGDLSALTGSIEAVGLLQPIVIRPDGLLIAGQRRLEACRLLGWKEIPVHVIDVEAIARGERDENMVRLPFTPEEIVEIGEAVEEEERKLAKVRQGTRTDLVENFHEVRGAGKSRDKIGESVGVSGRTYEKQKAVVQAARAEPEKFRGLVDDMNRTGRVDGPFKRLKVMKQAEEIKRAPSPLPRGPFPVIVVDPPWPYELRKADPSHRATHPYPQMSLADICALPIARMATPDCTLWLWTTNHHMREAFTVLDAWGFGHKTILTWAKDRMGTGDWLRGQTEHALMAVRGKPIVTLTNQTTLLHGPMRENSRKPDEFFAFVESLCPAPSGGYVSIFERYSKPGWVLWGDEAPNADAA